MIQKKWWSWAAIAVAVMMTASCAAGPDAPATPGAKDQVTLRVGLLAPTSGNSAAGGKDMVDGWNLWFKQNGDTYGNVKIETSVYDTASTPNKALTKARQAVQQDKSDVLVGTLLSSSALAIVPFATQNKIPFLIPEAGSDDLSQRKTERYVIKAGGWTSSQPAHVAGQWAYDEGYRRAITLVPSYAFGYENSGGFTQVFTDAGGKVVDQLFPPLGTTDFSPYLSKIQKEKPDAVFATLVGADGQIFLKQWETFGLKDTIPLINTQTTTDQSNLRQFEKSVIEGLVTVGYYAPGRDDPATSKFVSDFYKEYGTIPDSHAASLFVTAKWFTEAVKAVSDATDVEALVDAIRAVKLDNSPMGPYSLDKYGGPIFNVYLMKIVPTPSNAGYDEPLWNEILKTWPSVSQFWTYDPETYLKQPAYSEQFQGR